MDTIVAPAGVEAAATFVGEVTEKIPQVGRYLARLKEDCQNRSASQVRGQKNAILATKHSLAWWFCSELIKLIFERSAVQTWQWIVYGICCILYEESPLDVSQKSFFDSGIGWW